MGAFCGPGCSPGSPRSDSTQRGDANAQHVPEKYRLEANWRPLRHFEFYEAVTKAYPQALTKSMYAQPALDKPLFKMSKEEKRELFLDTLYNMMRAAAWGGRKIDEIAYDHTVPRLWSFALQGTWEVQEERRDANLQCFESLIAVHSGAWGIGLVLEVIKDLMNESLELYLLWKELEIRAALAVLRRFPKLPGIAINLRPTEWMLPRMQDFVVEVAREMGGRIGFEVTEYTDDEHFVKCFGSEGSLRDRLTDKLLPVLRRMKEEGVVLIADDLKPLSVYRFEDEESRKKGATLENSHATTADMVLSEEWLSVFSRVKFSIDWMIHSMRLSKDSGENYAKVPIYSFHVKDKPAHVAAMTDTPVPPTSEEEAEALRRLQDRAGSAFRSALPKARSCPHGPVIEATVPPGAIAEWGLDSNVGEQGGLFFEAKFPPQWYLGDVK